MPIFPPVRTFIGFPYAVSTVSLLAGTSLDAAQYPLTNLTDWTGKTAWRSNDVTVALRFDLGDNFPVNFVGVLSHNLTPGLLVSIHADTLIAGLPIPSFPPDDEYEEDYVLNTVLSRAVAARPPNFWLDTRDAQGNAATARYWQIHITGNDAPVTLGEVVIGLADEYDGVIATPFAERAYSWQSRTRLDQGAVVISGSGTVSRTMDLRLRLTPEERTALDEVYSLAAYDEDEARVVVVPDSRRNDLWYVEWPARREATFEASYRVGEQNVTLVEETFGAV